MKDAIKQFIENQYPNTEVAVGYIHSGKAFFMGMQKKEGDLIEVDLLHEVA